MIVGIGRLAPQKNWSLLLSALAHTPAEVRLILVGEGPLLDRLRREAEELGVGERVRFTKSLRDIGPALMAARLLAISSDYESGPAVLVEALAAGRPVVSTRCAPGMEDAYPASHLSLVPTGDALALAEAILGRLARAPTQVPLEALTPFFIGPIALAHLALIDGAL